MNKLSSTLAAGLMVLAGLPALTAQDIDIGADISGNFVTIAGSADNARQLVTGLRFGSEVTLRNESGMSVTITPVCGRMGWGNAYVVLALAQEEFEEFGLSNPDLNQLEVVLDGGTLTVNGRERRVQGILPLCQSAGDDWARVATTIGVSFDPVREHWRGMEERYGRAGGRTRLEADDRPKGEENWGRSTGENRGEEQNRAVEQNRPEDQNRQQEQVQEQQRAEQQNRSADEQNRVNDENRNQEQRSGEQANLERQQNQRQDQQRAEDQNRNRLRGEAGQQGQDQSQLQRDQQRSTQEQGYRQNQDQNKQDQIQNKENQDRSKQNDQNSQFQNGQQGQNSDRDQQQRSASQQAPGRDQDQKNRNDQSGNPNN